MPSPQVLHGVKNFQSDIRSDVRFTYDAIIYIDHELKYQKFNFMTKGFNLLPETKLSQIYNSVNYNSKVTIQLYFLSLRVGCHDTVRFIIYNPYIKDLFICIVGSRFIRINLVIFNEEKK